MRIIAGEARGRRLATPQGADSIRPALDRIRETVFSLIDDPLGAHALDLFAGVGSFGLEAISRGARRCVFVDSGREALALLRENVRRLHFQSRAEIRAEDALASPPAPSAEQAIGESFRFIFLDPPYRMFRREEDAARVIERLEELLGARWFEPGGSLVFRHPSDWSGQLPDEPTERRSFGESEVLIFTR